MLTAAETAPRLRASTSPLQQKIGEVLDRLYPAIRSERRGEERAAIPLLLKLTPREAWLAGRKEEATVVVGKNLSARGIGIFHHTPLNYRRAVVELDDPDLGYFAAELDLTWTRFTKLGWYESGGRLLKLLETPTS